MRHRRFGPLLSLTRRLLQFVHDPQFVRYAGIVEQPNVFRITGQARWERWHSAFWAWLLDPEGTHGLGDYGLRRLMTLVLHDDCVRDAKLYDGLVTTLLSEGDVRVESVRPNERDPSEVAVPTVGKFDAWIQARHTGTPGERRVNVLIEVKVQSGIRRDQSKKYADWLFDHHPSETNLAIFFLAGEAAGRTPADLVGDHRWAVMSYQLLHDELLQPILSHPSLNPAVQFVVQQYVHNLAVPHKGIKMAITQQERDLARTLYEKYSDVIDAIIEVLEEEEEVDASAIAPTAGRSRGRLEVRIDGKAFVAESVADAFEQILKVWVDTGVLATSPLPWGVSDKRYFVTKDVPPLHPNGRAFFSPKTYKGYTIETHKSRAQAMRTLQAFCEVLGKKCEIVDL